MARQKNCDKEDLFSAFLKENEKDGIRVFVAGGSRGGHNPIYVKEAYTLGKKIVEMGFKLDFGLSNSGIMGAVARGVMDAWNEKQHCVSPAFPIQGITTAEYYKLYDSDDKMFKHKLVIVPGVLGKITKFFSKTSPDKLTSSVSYRIQCKKLNKKSVLPS